MSGRKKVLKILLWAVLLLLVAAGVLGYGYYKKAFAPNVAAKNGNTFLYIKTGFTLDSVIAELQQRGLVQDIASFRWVADKKHYATHIHPGRYALRNGMSNNSLVDLLRSGKQEPVNVTFNNCRTEYDLAGKVGQYIEADSADLIRYFDTTSYFQSAGLNKYNFMTLFIPNTYSFYWNTSAPEFVHRMREEHDAFWSPKRKAEADSIGLTPAEVYILASIVYSESKRSDEAPRIAGVYMNRLKKNMPLQADPTVVYAIGDFSIRRVLDADKAVESPYNTYKYTGLPPGPIHMPPIAFIDAVLHYEHHDYLYLCARGDGSGYHYFAKTEKEHEKNSRRYHETLNKLRIYR